MDETKTTKEGNYTVSNGQPIQPRMYIPEDKDGRELLVKCIDRILENEKNL